MNKTMTMTGWLVMAAALTMSFTACSNDDNLVENPVLSTVTNSNKIHITVGAGIGDGTTRSAVVNDNGSRKLTFTTGDRLYVYANITGGGDESNGKETKKVTMRRAPIENGKIMAGYLTIDANSIGNGGTTATFSGDLDVWESGAEPWDPYTSSSYDFTTDDPLGECSMVYATLVHKDAGTAFVVDENSKKVYYDYEFSKLASTVDALMTSTLEVEGTYDSSNKRFSLAVADDEWGCSPIFNCNVTGGLTANAEYSVQLLCGANADNVGTYGTLGTVTANGSGAVSFACMQRVGKDSRYYAIRFKSTTNANDWKRINLGTKALESKVYNISRAAIADPDTPTLPTVTGATYTTPNEHGDSWIDGNGGALTFTISGTSRGICFNMVNFTSATVTLSNLDAKFDMCYLGGDFGKDVNIVLNGSNTITCRDTGECLFSGGNLKLSGNGTLTVTCNNEMTCGLYGNSNYNSESSNYNMTDEQDVTTQLAASGYTVTRSARSGDRPYTWTYTVSPTQN